MERVTTTRRTDRRNMHSGKITTDYRCVDTVKNRFLQRLGRLGIQILSRCLLRQKRRVLRIIKRITTY